MSKNEELYINISKKRTVGKHSQKIGDQILIRPRITLTGKVLQQMGFEVGDDIEIRCTEKGKLVIENLTTRSHLD